jgi:hypothetical protein
LTTKLQVFSEIECDYNADMLKKKLGKKDQIDDGHLGKMFTLAVNTLQVLTMQLRL